MKIECLSGYYRFSETESGQLSNFATLFDLDLDRNGDHITFADLVDAPDYSIAGGTFLGCPTLSTFAGRPWEVMEENDLVYDFVNGLVVPKLTILTVAEVSQASNWFISNGMIMGGSVTEDGSRVKDYAAFYVSERQVFRYSEIDYD